MKTKSNQQIEWNINLIEKKISVKSKCGHHWEVTGVVNLIPNNKIVDCLMKCRDCRKEVSGVIHINNGGEK